MDNIKNDAAMRDGLIFFSRVNQNPIKLVSVYIKRLETEKRSKNIPKNLIVNLFQTLGKWPRRRQEETHGGAKSWRQKIVKILFSRLYSSSFFTPLREKKKKKNRITMFDSLLLWLQIYSVLLFFIYLFFFFNLKKIVYSLYLLLYH